MSAANRRSRPQTDQESRHNLQFFFDHGVRANDGAHYVIVTQADDTSKARTHCPPLGHGALQSARRPLACRRPQGGDVEKLQVPSNVRFLRHQNLCYDWWAPLHPRRCRARRAPRQRRSLTAHLFRPQGHVWCARRLCAPLGRTLSAAQR